MTTLTLPDDLQDVFQEILAEKYAFIYRGKPVNFALKRNEHTYLYWIGVNGAMYCYTPHPSTDGDYFVWTYAPKGLPKAQTGEGARSDNAKRFVMQDVVRCATCRTAKMKALRRHAQDKGKRR